MVVKFDISKLGTSLADEGSEMVVLHPVTGEPTTMVIKLAGVDSQRHRDAVRRISERYIPRFERNPQARLSQDEQDKDHAELLADLTIGWHEFFDGDEPLHFTREKAFELYLNPHYRWLRAQVDTWIAKRSNFIRA